MGKKKNLINKSAIRGGKLLKIINLKGNESMELFYRENEKSPKRKKVIICFSDDIVPEKEIAENKEVKGGNENDKKN